MNELPVQNRLRPSTGAGFLALLVMIASSCNRAPKVEAQTASAIPTVAVAKVTKEELSHNLTLTAEFRPFQEIDVMAKVSGYVKEIKVDVGDRVQQGQLLATLEIPEMVDDLARARASVERSKDYVEAALSTPLPAYIVVFRHILPNCLPPLIVVATVQIANSISLEATLSFLGLGLPPTEPSLGMLIANGFQYLMSGRYWISIYPGVALIVLIVAINLVGDQVRDQLNPRLRR